MSRVLMFMWMTIMVDEVEGLIAIDHDIGQTMNMHTQAFLIHNK